MYSLLVASIEGTWDQKSVDWPQDRFLSHTAYYAQKKVEQAGPTFEEALVRIPALLTYESSLELPARVAWIKEVTFTGSRIALHFERVIAINPIPSAAIQGLVKELGIEAGELHTRHWALKDVDLADVLLRYRRLTGSGTEHRAFIKRAMHWDQPTSTTASRPRAAPAAPVRSETKAPVRGPHEKPRVFIVHGHDEVLQSQVARFLERMGMEAVILHEQPNRGHTIISKFKEHAVRADYAIVLMTPDDVGGIAGNDLKPRARQNVIFELGFFFAQLTSERVAALVKGGVETPSDFDGVLYIDADRNDWQRQLVKELRAAGLPGNYEAALAG